MKTKMRTHSNIRTALSLLILCLVSALAPAAHAELPPAAQAKVDKYKKLLSEWAKDPVIVAAVKEANGSDGIPGMTNAKWDALVETDAAVTAVQTNPAGQLVTKLEADTGINKLYLRDGKGNIIAASNKPLLYSIANRPAMTVMATSQPWAQGEVKPDPTTQIKSVQLAVPVMDHGKPIGVLHTGVTIE